MCQCAVYCRQVGCSWREKSVHAVRSCWHCKHAEDYTVSAHMCTEIEHHSLWSQIQKNSSGVTVVSSPLQQFSSLWLSSQDLNCFLIQNKPSTMGTATTLKTMINISFLYIVCWTIHWLLIRFYQKLHQKTTIVVKICHSFTSMKITFWVDDGRHI